MQKPQLPTAEDKHWMAHYWEAANLHRDIDTRKFTAESLIALEKRIRELETESERRRIDGKKFQGLLDEMAWRKKQLATDQGES